MGADLDGGQIIETEMPVQAHDSIAQETKMAATDDEISLLRARLILAERRIAWLEEQVLVWQKAATLQQRARVRLVTALAIGEAILEQEEYEQAQR
jgi:hypothetical protein